MAMSRPLVFPAEDKVRIVLSVLSGEMTIAEAARRSGFSEQSVSRWKGQFQGGSVSSLCEVVPPFLWRHHLPSAVTEHR
jgi:transposase